MIANVPTQIFPSTRTILDRVIAFEKKNERPGITIAQSLHVCVCEKAERLGIDTTPETTPATEGE